MLIGEARAREENHRSGRLLEARADEDAGGDL